MVLVRGRGGAITTPGLALRRRPGALLVTSWPWRSLAYLMATPFVAVTWLLTCWPCLVLAGVPLGRLERRRVRWIDARPVADPHTSVPDDGFTPWVRHRLREPATWTELLYGALLVPLSLLGFAVMTLALLVPIALIGSGGLVLTFQLLGIAATTIDATIGSADQGPIGFILLGLVLLAGGMYAVTLAAEGQRYLCRLLLGDAVTEPTERLDDLTRSRARITTAFDEERRRIERDLHDGAQQRLTALVMTLGTMRYQHGQGTDITPLINRAHTDAQRAIDELREIVHGVYPAALRDHDLANALEDLAANAEIGGTTVNVRIDLPEELPTDVETGVYFAVSELFTNIGKHSGASEVVLLARHFENRTLRVTVEDNGCGGIRRDTGTGLIGVVDRVETLGGHVTISSPVGGPTRIRLEVPCASS